MVVACGVFGILRIICVFADLFGLAAHHISFALLSLDIGDESLFGLEIVAHCLRLIACAVVFEDRCPECVADRVYASDGVDRRVVKIHLDFLRVKLQSAVFHFGAAIHICVVASVEHEGVFG